jgi:uncharacterized membrane protein (DUF106 family)
VKPSRVILIWVVVIGALLLVEVAEVTHLFTLPVQSALGDLLSFIFALVFTTILALVGAIFIGIYISHRILSPRGFTPFEEEMLRMRADVRDLKEEIASIRRDLLPDGIARTGHPQATGRDPPRAEEP